MQPPLAEQNAPARSQDKAFLAYECRDVVVEFDAGVGRRRVLNGVNLDVERGSFVSILGTSGAGKTTLLRVLAGLLDPTPGSTVICDDVPVTGPPDGAVTVFQDYSSALLPWRTVARNVGLGIERSLSKHEVKDRVSEALQRVGLDKSAHDYPWQLSGGMQQRVQIARALAMRPSVLLMDEPFGSLDAMTKAYLQDELSSLHDDTDTTIIFITHDIDEAVFLSDRILVLTGSPSVIGHEVQVDLPRPRDHVSTRELDEFIRIRHDVWTIFGQHEQ